MSSSVEIPIVDIKGKQVDQYSAPSELFSIEPNENAVHFVVKGQLFRFYKKNASTKTRSAVNGGGKKFRKQKGTGGARHGGNRAPTFVGGGIAHGPHPIKRHFHVNKKIKKLALASVLSDRCSGGQVKILRDGLAAAKTQSVATFLKEYQGARVGFVVDRNDLNIARSCRNIKNVDLLTEEKWTTLDFVKADALVFTENAMAALTKQALVTKIGEV